MSITRVDYRERQRLTAADLRQEQDYRLGLGGRHAIAHHRAGIVRGLRIVQTEAGTMLTPGIAFDGHGREIFVPREVEIDLEGKDPKGCWFVQIHYCEDPEQVPAGRQCADDPAPRIRQRTLVRVTERFDPPDESSDDLARARAAGTSGLAPWPVLVARYGKGCSEGAAEDAALIDYSRTTYVGHRASMIRSPNAGTTMQLGLASRLDYYHLLISTRGSERSPSKRIGVDRDGTVHVWRQLMISASEAVGSLNIGHNLALRIQTPMPAGPGSRVRIEGEFDPLLHEISASLIDTGAASPGPRPVRRGTTATLQLTSVPLAFEGGRVAKVELFDIAKRGVIPFYKGRQRLSSAQNRSATPAPPPAGAPAKPNPISFSLSLDPLNARLVLLQAKSNGATDPAAPAIVFKPAAELEADELAREVHAVITSKPTDMALQTELRISGGAGDDTDASTRVSVGVRDNDDKYVAALGMDGGRRLVISARPGGGNGPLLSVKRTTYLPPIGSKDPLLPDLLMLAYIGGLRRVGNVTTAATLRLESRHIVGLTKQPTILAYDIKITWGPVVTIKRTLELVTAPEGKGDLSFRSLLIERASNAASQTARFEIKNFTRPESTVEVVVLMLVEIGNRARVVVSNPLTIVTRT